jgi:hypothetical protein
MKTDEEIKAEYFATLYPKYKDLGTQRLIAHELAKRMKARGYKTSKVYKMPKKQLYAILIQTN